MADDNAVKTNDPDYLRKTYGGEITNIYDSDSKISEIFLNLLISSSYEAIYLLLNIYNTIKISEIQKLEIINKYIEQIKTSNQEEYNTLISDTIYHLEYFENNIYNCQTVSIDDGNVSVNFMSYSINGKIEKHNEKSENIFKEIRENNPYLYKEIMYISSLGDIPALKEITDTVTVEKNAAKNLVLSDHFKTNESINEKLKQAKAKIESYKKTEPKKYLDILLAAENYRQKREEWVHSALGYKTKKTFEEQQAIEFMAASPEDYGIDKSLDQDEKLKIAREKFNDYEKNNLEKYLDIIMKAKIWVGEQQKYSEIAKVMLKFFGNFIDNFELPDSLGVDNGNWHEVAKNYLGDLYKNNPEKYKKIMAWAEEKKKQKEKEAAEKKAKEEKERKEKEEKKRKEQQEKFEKEEKERMRKEHPFAAEFMAATDKYYTEKPEGSYAQKVAIAKEDLIKYEKNDKDTYKKIMNAAHNWQSEEINKYVKNCKTAYKEALAAVPKGEFNAQFAEQIKNTKEKNLKEEYKAIMDKAQADINSTIPYLWDTQANQGGNILYTWLEKRIQQEREKPDQEQSTSTYKNCIERVLDEIKSFENQATKKENPIHQVDLDFHKIVYLQHYEKLEADLKHKKIDIDFIIPVKRSSEEITNEIKNAFTALDIALCDGQGARKGIGAGLFSKYMQEAYHNGSRIRTWFKAVEEQLAFEVTFKYKTDGKTTNAMDATDFLVRAKERFAHKKAFMYTPALIILDVYTSFFYEWEREENLGWQGKTYMAKHTSTRTITCEVTATLYEIGMGLSKSDSMQYDPQAGKEMVPVRYRKGA